MAGGIRLDSGHRVLGVTEPAAPGKRTPECERGGQTAAVGERPLREIGGEIRVAGDVGRVRPSYQELGRDRRVRVEQHPHDAQRVLGRQPLAPAQRLGETHAQAAGAQRRERGTNRIPVEGMREPHVV